MSLVTEPQRRDVLKMQRELDLEVGFQSPGDGNVAPRPGTAAEASRGRSSRHAGPTARTGARPRSIYVANLPWRVTSDDLTAHFSRCGVVEQSTIVTDRRSGRSRGFGFVEMAPADAERAVHQLDGSHLDGRALKVRLARPAR